MDFNYTKFRNLPQFKDEDFQTRLIIITDILHKDAVCIKYKTKLLARKYANRLSDRVIN